MRKSDEIKQEITKVRNEVERLQGEEQYDAAMAKAKELKDLTRECEIQMALEASEFKNFMSGMITQRGNGAFDKNEKGKIENRIFNKLLLGVKNNWKLTEEEKEYMNAVGTPGLVEAVKENGGYLVPDEQFNQIIEYRRAYTELKKDCTVRPVARRTGKQPTIGEEGGELIEFEELTQINGSGIDFGQIAYEIKGYGDIIKVSNELLADADVNIVNIVGQRFARKSINTENKKILEIIETIDKEAVVDYKGIIKTINTKLDPAISAMATIYTNQTGYNYLDELEDNQGRPLLTPSLADSSVMMFRGKRVVMLSDKLMPNDTKTEGTTKAPFAIGLMSDLIHFFDRKGVEIALSDAAGFTINATLLRCIERFDVKKNDGNAMKYLQMTIK